MYVLLLNMNVEVKLLDHKVCSVFRCPVVFSEELYQFMLPPVVYEISSSPHPCQPLLTLVIFILAVLVGV